MTATEKAIFDIDESIRLAQKEVKHGPAFSNGRVWASRYAQDCNYLLDLFYATHAELSELKYRIDSLEK